MIHVYEGMFIFDPSRYARETEAVSGQVSKIISELGGEVLVSRLWEERRLAYPINGNRKGVYWLVYFKLESRKVAELYETARISESIMRTLVLKIDPRIADALVAHASGTAQPKAKAAEPAAVAAVAAPAAAAPAAAAPPAAPVAP